MKDIKTANYIKMKKKSYSPLLILFSLVKEVKKMMESGLLIDEAINKVLSKFNLIGNQDVESLISSIKKHIENDNLVPGTDY